MPAKASPMPLGGRVADTHRWDTGPTSIVLPRHSLALGLPGKHRSRSRWSDLASSACASCASCSAVLFGGGEQSSNHLPRTDPRKYKPKPTLGARAVRRGGKQTRKQGSVDTVSHWTKTGSLQRNPLGAGGPTRAAHTPGLGQVPFTRCTVSQKRWWRRGMRKGCER